MEPAAGAAAKPFGDRIRRHQTQERDREAPVLRGRRLLVASVCQFCGSTALSVLFGGVPASAVHKRLRTAASASAAGLVRKGCGCTLNPAIRSRTQNPVADP